VKGVENFKDVSHIPNSFFLSRLPLDFLFIFFAISRAKVLCTDFCSLHGKKKMELGGQRFFFPLFLIIFVLALRFTMSVEKRVWFVSWNA
jgi:hypothetical protein